MDGPSPRIVKETKTIQSDPVPGIAFKPDSTNFKHFFIELQGTASLIKDLLELAMKMENSRLNYYFQMIIPCHLPRSSSTPRSTTLTLVCNNLKRQSRQNMPRYSQKELVTCIANEVSAPVDSKSDG
jgi:hypothetical protein